MKLSKKQLIICSFIFCNLAIAQSDDKNYITKELTYGGSISTAYSDNVNSDSSKIGSTYIKVNPFIAYNKKFVNSELNLSYRPEFRGYLNKDVNDQTQLDHHFDAGVNFDITPLQSLSISNNYSDITGDTSGEINDVSSANNNDYSRNITKVDYSFEFLSNQFLKMGYMHEYLDYKDSINSYRSFNSDELYLAYERAVSRDLKLGGKFLYGRTNHDDVNSFDSSRDTEWFRYLLTSSYQTGPWSLATEAGLENRKVLDKVYSGGDDNTVKPYLDMTLAYRVSSLSSVNLNYKYRMVESSLKEFNLATQSRIRLGWDYTFHPQLKMSAYSAYDNLFFEKDYSVYGSSNDHEEWLRFGVNLTYTIWKNLEAVAGVETSHIINETSSGEKYEVTDYNIGVKYTF